MIWDAHDAKPCGRRALREHVTSEIVAACKDLDIAHDRIIEIAEGVAAFCARNWGAGYARSDDLLLLTALALWGSGEEHAAWRVLERRSSGHVHRDTFVGALSQGKMSPSFWSAVASGIVRPSQWLVQNDAVVWVLDLSRIRLDPTDLFELSLLQGLRSLIYSVSEIWDASGGAGFLGLRGASRKSVSAQASQAGWNSDELLSYLSAVLESLARSRGWGSVPQVVSLDLCA